MGCLELCWNSVRWWGGVSVCVVGSSDRVLFCPSRRHLSGSMRLVKCIAGYSQIAFVTLWINIQGLRSLNRMRAEVRILTVLIFALMVVSTPQSASLATGSANDSAKPVAVDQATTMAPSGSYFDHVVIILMENEGVYDICLSSPPPCSASGPAPYMASLANTYGIGSQYLSIINTSQPNYVALIGGSTLNSRMYLLGLSDDYRAEPC